MIHKDMKKFMKPLLLLSILAAAITAHAQEDPAAAAQDEECNIKASLYYESLKVKNYKDAYENWLYCVEHCPTMHPNMYMHGVDILAGLLDQATDENEKSRLRTQLIETFDKRLELFPNDRRTYVLVQKAAKLAKYNAAEPEGVISIIREAIACDRAELDAVALDLYFVQAATLLNEKKYTLSQMFDIYDEITEILDMNRSALQLRYNKIMADRDTTQQLDPATAREVKMLEALLRNNEIVTNNVDKRMEPLATCDRLVKLYTEQFEENKANETWLRKSVQLLQRKGCIDQPIYVKAAEAYYALSPNARAARAIALLSIRNDDYRKAAEYFRKAAEESDNESDKARNYFNLAQAYAKLGQKASSRTAAQTALGIDPGMGEAWMLIGQLYASSSNECGTNEFEKRAVHYAAIDMYRKALAADPSVAEEARKAISHSQAYAPDRTLIFQMGRGGEKLTIGCWMNYTVTIPNL